MADSDLNFVLRQLWRKLGLVIRIPWRILRGVLRRLGWLFVLGMGAGMLLWYFKPYLVYATWQWIQWAWWRVNAWF
jgi:hypothetical protein